MIMEKSLATHLPRNTELEEFDLVILGGGGTGRVWRLK